MVARNSLRAQAIICLILSCLILPFSGCTNSQVSTVLISPSGQNLTVGQTLQFTASGTVGHGSHPATTTDVTNQVTWASSTLSVATVNSAGLATAVGAGTTTITASLAGSNPGSTTLSVASNGKISTGGEPLVSLAIVPGSQSATAVNQTAQFIAIATTSSGATVNLTNVSATVGTATIKPAAWGSSDVTVSTVNAATGLATAAGAGTATITAIATNPDGTIVAGTATYSVTTPSGTTGSGEPLVSLAIVPAAQTLTQGNQSAGLIAIGTTSNGTTVNLTNQSATIGTATIKAAAWSSSVPSVATINSATGLATSVASGTTAITAVATNPDGTIVTGVATITVAISGSPEPLVSLAIVPGAQTLTSAGQPAQFIAIGTTSSGTTVNLTNKTATIGSATINAAAWSSSSMPVATINAATGLATAGTSGTTAITAIAYNPDGTAVTANAALTVNIPGSPEPLVSLAVVPAAQTALAVDQTAQFIAIGTTSTGTTVNLTNQSAVVGSNTIAAATWTSSNPAVASVNSGTGVATALGAGSAAMIAIAKNPDGTVVTGTAAYTVTIPGVAEPLVSMAIVPPAQTLTSIGETAHLTAIATTGTGSTVNLTNQTATISGNTIQAAAWLSSAPGVATVNAGTGVVTAVSAGATVITAIASNPDGTIVTGVSTVTVTATGGPGGSIASIAVIPGDQSVQGPNDTAQFTAIGTTTTGATVNLTNQVQWGISSAQIGTIGAATGLATAGASPGTATITALYTPGGGGNVVTGTASFTVNSGTSEQYTAVTIIPNAQTLSVGQTNQFIALGTLGTSGAMVDVTNSPQIKWSSSVGSGLGTIASVNSSGSVMGVSAGSATITAELSNPDNTVVSSTATITVSQTTVPEPLLSLTIVPNSITVGNLQDTGNFLAIGTFSQVPYVRDLTNAPGTTWISSFPESFPVTTNSGGNAGASAGTVTAYGTGGATIIAEATSADGTIQTATATFSCPLVLPNPPTTAGSCFPGSQASGLLVTLTVYNEGLNSTNWLVTAPSATSTPDVLHCGPGWNTTNNPSDTGGSVCTATYPVGTTNLLLTAPAQTGVNFGGWSSDCTPSDVNGNPLPGPVFYNATGPNYCTISLGEAGNSNVTVGAIFN